MPRKTKSPRPIEPIQAAVRVDTSAEFSEYISRSLRSAKLAFILAAGALLTLVLREDITITLAVTLAIASIAIKVIFDWMRYNRDIRASSFEFLGDTVLWIHNSRSEQFSVADIKEIRRPDPSKSSVGFDYRDVRLRNGKRIFLFSAFPNYEHLAEQFDRFKI